mmetsp:Transcript_2222/g.5154  ORF Transcript_2222/g.5154 Transcript_2222/m.5154 type:complete len:166 (-) Transcript_2222:120-617(-)
MDWDWMQWDASCWASCCAMNVFTTFFYRVARRGGVGGIFGLLMCLPGLPGRAVAVMVNRWILSRVKHFALPNIWAGTCVVPELVGKVDPARAAESIGKLIRDPVQMERMKRDLAEVVRGQDEKVGQHIDAAAAIAKLCINHAKMGGRPSRENDDEDGNGGAIPFF